MDNKQHQSPHIHAKYQDNEVILAIPNSDILEGSMPIAVSALVRDE